MHSIAYLFYREFFTTLVANFDKKQNLAMSEKKRTAEEESPDAPPAKEQKVEETEQKVRKG